MFPLFGALANDCFLRSGKITLLSLLNAPEKSLFSVSNVPRKSLLFSMKYHRKPLTSVLSSFVLSFAFNVQKITAFSLFDVIENHIVFCLMPHKMFKISL